MSIIYEALKKAEAGKGPLSKESAEEADFVSKDKKSPFFKSRIRDIGLFLLLFLIGGFFLVNKYLPVRNKLLQTTNKGAGIKKAVEEIKPKGLSKKKVYKGYVLEGIMYDQDDPSAIINGRVIRKNDSIDDLVVADITQDGVDLSDNQTKEITHLSISF